MDNERSISNNTRRLTALLVLMLAAGAALLGASIPAAMADNPPAPTPRLTIPDAAAQMKTEKLIRDVFGNYAAAPLAQRPAIASKLIDQAMASVDDPVGRYVLLKDGADLAASGSDAATAMRAATLLASMYAVDEGELKLSLLRRAASAATAPNSAAAVASQGLNCANDAVAAGNYDLAGRLMLPTEQAAHTSKNLPLMLSVQSRAADIKWLEQESVRAKAAEEKLDKSPTDPDANHILGRYFCLVRGDWLHGLVGLSKGSNPAYQAAATVDLANPTTSDKQVAAGDLWWDLADKETAGTAQKSLRRRAGYWYAQAAANPQLTGLRRALVMKKLSQIPPLGEAVAEVPVQPGTPPAAAPNPPLSGQAAWTSAFDLTPDASVNTQGELVLPLRTSVGATSKKTFKYPLKIIVDVVCPSDDQYMIDIGMFEAPEQPPAEKWGRQNRFHFRTQCGRGFTTHATVTLFGVDYRVKDKMPVIKGNQVCKVMLDVDKSRTASVTIDGSLVFSRAIEQDQNLEGHIALFTGPVSSVVYKKIEISDNSDAAASTTAPANPTAAPARNAPPGPAGSIFDGTGAPAGADPAEKESHFIGQVESSLSAAVARAKREDKGVFLVIYDGKNPTHSRVDYALTCFMRFENTKKLLAEHFVPVVADVHSSDVARYVPAGNPLDACYYVAFSANGKILKQEEVLANASEGLKRAQAIVQKWEESRR